MYCKCVIIFFVGREYYISSEKQTFGLYIISIIFFIDREYYISSEKQKFRLYTILFHIIQPIFKSFLYLYSRDIGPNECTGVTM